jgi:hypothetical protein
MGVGHGYGWVWGMSMENATAFRGAEVMISFSGLGG